MQISDGRTLKDKLKNFKISQGFDIFEHVLHAISWRLPWWLFSYDHTLLIYTREPKLLVRKYTAYAVRYAIANDADIMEGAGINRGLFLHRLERGDNCVIVIKDGRVITWSWAAKGRLFLKLSGSIIDIGDDCFFLYDIYTVPEERFKGFIMVCFKMQMEHYHKENRRDIYSTISAFNTPSIKTHLHMGFRLCGETFCVVIAGISFCYYKLWPFHARKWHIYIKRPPENLEWA